MSEIAADDPATASDPGKSTTETTAPPPSGPRIGGLVLLLLVAGSGLLAGVRWAGPLGRAAARVGEMTGLGAHDTPGGSDHARTTYYTCGMHPWVILPAPGACPICGMTLVPLDPAKFSGEITIDPVIVQNTGVRLGMVTRGPLVRTIRTVGNLTYDETRVRDVNVKVDGWIEKLHVDFLGAAVEQGAPLFEIYSPALFSAQQEYLIAYRGRDLRGLGVGPDSLQQSRDLLESARVHLEYYDITPAQIRAIEKAGQPAKTMTVRSPYGGVVIEKAVNEGMKIEAGQRVFRIADLSRVWVKATLYEYQLPFLELGQKAVMTLPYIPGQSFEGRVLYIYPYLDSTTRTVEVRLAFPNPHGLLKPGMFADVALSSRLAEDRTLAPREAVLDTGVRKVAFVSLGDGHFEPRQVRTGTETEDGRIEILAGLAPGERIVTSGQFLLDSEAKTRDALAKMVRGQPAAEQVAAAEVAGASDLQALPPAVAGLLGRVLDDDFAIGAALATDSLTGVADQARALADAMGALVATQLPDYPHFWHRHPEAARARGAALELAEAGTLEAARGALTDLDASLSTLLRATGIPPDYPHEVQELTCPMWRKGQGGGLWIQPAGAVRNPFLGSAMSGCSDARTTLPVTGRSGGLDPGAEGAEAEGGHGSPPLPGRVPSTAAGPPSPQAQEHLDLLVRAYLSLEAALVGGDVGQAKTPLADLSTNALALATTAGDPARRLATLAAEGEDDLATLRVRFKELSATLVELLRLVPQGAGVAPVLYRAWCPMAKADWLQTSPTISNPYYGSAMPTCGSVREEFHARIER